MTQPVMSFEQLVVYEYLRDTEFEALMSKTKEVGRRLGAMMQSGDWS